MEIFVDDQRAASDVENPDPILHLRERFGVEPALGLRRFRQVKRDEIGLGVELLRACCLRHAKLAVALAADEWIKSQDLHPEGLRAGRDELPDSAEAENAERLVEQFNAGVLGALPAALSERAVCLRHVAG